MSSSPSRAPVPAPASPGAAKLSPVLQPFPYDDALARRGQPACRGVRRTARTGGIGTSAATTGRWSAKPRLASWDARRDWPKRRAISTSNWRGSAQCWPQALADFARDRAAYYQKVEEEVVQPGAEHCAQGICTARPRSIRCCWWASFAWRSKRSKAPPGLCCGASRRS